MYIELLSIQNQFRSNTKPIQNQKEYLFDSISYDAWAVNCYTEIFRNGVLEIKSPDCYKTIRTFYLLV